jgi:hypothetical protein
MNELMAPPAAFDHCIRVYAILDEEAVLEDVKTEDETLNLKVWSGALTKVFQRLELATPYYTSVMAHLKAMGCVEQLSRGGGSAPSKWVLYQEPTRELFDEAPAMKPQKTADRLKALEQQVRDLTKMVQTLAKAQGVQF